MKTTKKCSYCKEEIAKKAIICPKCGCKQKASPKMWAAFFVILILSIIVIACNSNNENTNPVPKTEPQEQIEYTIVTAHELNSLLNKNPTMAEDYTDKYVEITGVICGKDSDGGYINLNCGRDLCEQCFLHSVRCDIENDATEEIIKPMDIGTKVTLRMKITTVGEYVGYSGDIIEVVQ